jgi:hypothetical protein
MGNLSLVVGMLLVRAMEFSPMAYGKKKSSKSHGMKPKSDGKKDGMTPKAKKKKKKAY